VTTNSEAVIYFRKQAIMVHRQDKTTQQMELQNMDGELKGKLKLKRPQSVEIITIIITIPHNAACLDKRQFKKNETKIRYNA